MVTAVLFMSSHRSRLPLHLQLVKYSRSMHASGVARWRRRSLRSSVEEEKTKKITEALCFAPVKASDSWMIVYYCKWLCGTLRKPLEYYSSSQTSDRAGVCLLIPPDALLVCCVQSESKMSSTVWSLWWLWGFTVVYCTAQHHTAGRDDGTEDGGQAEGGEASLLLSHAVIPVNRDDTEEVNWLICVCVCVGPNVITHTPSQQLLEFTSPHFPLLAFCCLVFHVQVIISGVVGLQVFVASPVYRTIDDAMHFLPLY